MESDIFSEVYQWNDSLCTSDDLSSCSRCLLKHRAPAVGAESNSRLTQSQQQSLNFSHTMTEVMKSHCCLHTWDASSNL